MDRRAPWDPPDRMACLARLEEPERQDSPDFPVGLACLDPLDRRDSRGSKELAVWKVPQARQERRGWLDPLALWTLAG